MFVIRERLYAHPVVQFKAAVLEKLVSYRCYIWHYRPNYQQTIQPH